jgi:hypothetical protein
MPSCITAVLSRILATPYRKTEPARMLRAGPGEVDGGCTTGAWRENSGS